MRLIPLLRNLVIGAVAGVFIVFLAARDGGAQSGIHWDWTLYGAAAGAMVAVALTVARRLWRPPQDWPTIDEFRRGRRHRDVESPKP